MGLSLTRSFNNLEYTCLNKMNTDFFLFKTFGKDVFFNSIFTLLIAKSSPKYTDATEAFFNRAAPYKVGAQIF